MKTFKKLFSVSAIVALLGTLAPMYAFGATYDTELTNAYEYAHAKGITTMSSIDNADMYGNLSRIAMAKMIANFATTVLGLEPDTSAKCTFTDVTASLDAQYDNGVTNACQLGLMGQNITAFRPNDPVTRGEFGTTLSRALNANSDDLAAMNAADPFYKEHLNFLKEEGIMNNISNPNQVEVRGYVMLMMMRADDSYTPATAGCSAEELLACITADDYDACIAACSDAEEEEEELPGYATVSTKAAAEQAVPYDAVKVTVGTITLKAGDNDTKVSSVEISRDGLFNTTAGTVSVSLRNADVETDSVVVSNSTNKAKVKFSPALQLKAKESMTFDVVVDLAGAANTNNNDTHNFKVTDVVVSNGTSAGYPAKLGTIKTTAAASKTFTAEFEQGDTPLKAGETGKKLVAVKITFNNADGTLDRITLGATVAGISPKADLDELFANVKAYVDDKEVGTVSVADEKIIISDLNLSKEKYDTVKVELRGDVISTQESNTVVFNASNAATNASSVEATESSYGFGMKLGAVITASTAITVNGYDFTFKKATLENKTVVPGTNNVLVFDSTIKTTTDVVIKELDIVTAATTVLVANTDLKAGSARILVNGEEYPLTDTQAVAGQAAFPVNVNIDAGKEARIQILFNTTDNADGKDIKYTVKIKDVKGVEKNATNFAPAAGIIVNGDQVKFSAASVTVAAATETAPATRSLFANKDQEMGRFSIKANGEKVTVKGLTLTLDENIATDPATYVDSNLSLVDVATDETINATFATLNGSDIVVTNMNYSIEKDKTANIKVMINMPSIDATDFGKTMKLSVKLNSIKANANGKDITTNALTALSSEDYTLRNTAPEITLSKASDNMFKLTIKNMDDNDDGIEFNDLTYRVRTTASENKFDGKVCIVEDRDTGTCGAIANNFGKIVNYTRNAATPAVAAEYLFTPDETNAATIANVATADVSISASSNLAAQVTAINSAAGALYTASDNGDGKIRLVAKTAGAIATAPTNTKAAVTEDVEGVDAGTARSNFKLSKNGEKVLYILIEGDAIEPDVLKADVTSLSYDKDNADYTDALTAEKYNVSKMLNE